LVKKGGFHLFSRCRQKGLFSILAPRYEDRQTWDQYELGEAQADFVSAGTSIRCGIYQVSPASYTGKIVFHVKYMFGIA
jgi:hypothetical protein